MRKAQGEDYIEDGELSRLFDGTGGVIVRAMWWKSSSYMT